MKLFPLHLALFAFAVGVFAQCAPVEADAWTPDEVGAARHCISEASGAMTNDCRVIVWIDQQNAARRGVSVAEFIATQHHRHTRSASRPWLAGLDASMSEPEGWPVSVSWAGRGRPAWEAALLVARGVLRGDEGHGCDANPLVWGGPGPDRERLDRMLSNGWVRVDCGETRNWFLRRVR
jgi:hypothetical protein